MRTAELILGLFLGILSLPMMLIGALAGLRGVGRYLRIKYM